MGGKNVYYTADWCADPAVCSGMAEQVHRTMLSRNATSSGKAVSE